MFATTLNCYMILFLCLFQIWQCSPEYVIFLLILIAYCFVFNVTLVWKHYLVLNWCFFLIAIAWFIMFVNIDLTTFAKNYNLGWCFFNWPELFGLIGSTNFTRIIFFFLIFFFLFCFYYYSIITCSRCFFISPGWRCFFFLQSAWQISTEPNMFPDRVLRFVVWPINFTKTLKFTNIIYIYFVSLILFANIDLITFQIHLTFC